MARRNIFELLADRTDLTSEVNRIEELSQETVLYDYSSGYSLEEFVDEYCFKKWKSRSRLVTCEQMRDKLKIDTIVRYVSKVEDVLIYLEYLSNLIWLCDREVATDAAFEEDEAYGYLKENVLGLIDDLGYEAKAFEDIEQVIVTNKNNAATSVAEIIEPEYIRDVLEYNHHAMKGDIDKKQRILNALANKFEEIRPVLEPVNKSLASNIGFMLNNLNIRHNNISGKNEVKYVKDMLKTELEEWYDETYQMILLAVLEVDNIERNKKVGELKRFIENK